MSTVSTPPEPSETFTPFDPSQSTTASSTTGSTSPANQTGPAGNPAGSELYLFTFLTTLLLLLGVSTAIIIRSLILRRRFRRRVQEAIANGVLIPGLTTESTPRIIGEKPKMWEVWISRPDNGLGNSTSTGDEDSDMPVEKGLSGALPIAATKLAPSMSSNSTSLSQRRQSGLMPSHQGIYGTQSPPLFHRFWPRRPRVPTPTPTPSNLEAQTEQQPGSPVTQPPAGTSSATPTSIPSSSSSSTPPASSNSPTKTVQVSLLIAMPTAAQSRYEAYIAQSNPSKGAIPLPLPQLHPPTGQDHSTPVTVSDSITSKDVNHNTTISTVPDKAANADADAEVADGESTKIQAEGDPKSDTPTNTNPHRQSTSSMIKGKMPEHPSAHLHPHGAQGIWSHLEEGEIPYMEFGVLEVNLGITRNGGGRERVDVGATTVNGSGTK